VLILYHAWEKPDYYCRRFREDAIKHIGKGNEDFLAYGIFIDDLPIMVRVYLRTIDDKALRDEINISYAMSRKDELVGYEGVAALAEKLRNGFASAFSYYITEEFRNMGIEYCFEGGAVSEGEKENGGIWEHKNLHCTGRIIHFKSKFLTKGDDIETDNNKG